MTKNYCTRCKGDGCIECPPCDGDGWLVGDASQVMTCARCDGEGVVTCPACNGTGETDDE